MKTNFSQRSSHPVAIWLLVGVGMMIIQVLLGGITRLTGSGLSITEWKPIMGVLPPTNNQQWSEAFDKYKQIAQYKYLNSSFTLKRFQIHIFLGVVSSFVGKIDRCSLHHPLHYFFNSEKI